MVRHGLAIILSGGGNHPIGRAAQQDEDTDTPKWYNRGPHGFRSGVDAWEVMIRDRVYDSVTSGRFFTCEADNRNLDNDDDEIGPPGQGEKEMGKRVELPSVLGQGNGEKGKRMVEREMRGGLGGGTSQINGQRLKIRFGGRVKGSWPASEQSVVALPHMLWTLRS